MFWHLLVLGSLGVFSQGPFDGTYFQQFNATSDCALYIRIRYLSFVSVIGPCSSGGTPGAMLGTYDVQPSDPSAKGGVVTFSYTSVLGNFEGVQPGMSMPWVWVVNTDGSLDLSNALLGTVHYVRRPSTVIDGNWVWNVNGTVITNEMIDGIFLSLSFDPTTKQPPTPAFGLYWLFNPNELDVYYNYGPIQLVNTLGNGTFDLKTKLSIKIHLEGSDQDVQLTGGTMQPIHSFWEGVWSGSTTFPDQSQCVTTAEFRRNLWHGFQTACTSSTYLQFGSYIGTFQVNQDGSVAVTYGFVDANGKGDDGLAGRTIQFDVKRTKVGSLEQVELFASDSPSITRLVKLTN